MLRLDWKFGSCALVVAAQASLSWCRFLESATAGDGLYMCDQRAIVVELKILHCKVCAASVIRRTYSSEISKLLPAGIEPIAFANSLGTLGKVNRIQPCVINVTSIKSMPINSIK